MTRTRRTRHFPKRIMIWQVRKRESGAVHLNGHLLPWAGRGPVACACITGREYRWLSPPPDLDEFPVLSFTPDELKTTAAWKELLRLFPAHRLDVAAYSAVHPEIPAEAFIEAIGLKVHYRSLAEWKEAGTFSAATIEFGRTYDFSVDVLRLWERLLAEDRSGWSELFLARNFKKNLIRDIILDLYDLNQADRNHLLEEARIFSRDWHARSGHFPAEEIRDLVRTRRYPRIEQLKKEIYFIKKELGLPPGVQLAVPPDLEAKRLQISLEFSSAAELESQLKELGAKDRLKRIQSIIDKL